MTCTVNRGVELTNVTPPLISENKSIHRQTSKHTQTTANKPSDEGGGDYKVSYFTNSLAKLRFF